MRKLSKNSDKNYLFVYKNFCYKNFSDFFLYNKDKSISFT